MKHLVALALIAGLVTPAFAAPMESPAVRERIIATVKDGRQACISCDLFQADFSYTDLSGRRFNGSRLRQADLQLAEADGVDFAGADLSVLNGFGARFTRANFAGTDLSQANLVGAYFGGANLTGAKLAGAVLSGAELREARGLTQAQISLACGDGATTLPAGLSIPRC